MSEKSEIPDNVISIFKKPERQQLRNSISLSELLEVPPNTPVILPSYALVVLMQIAASYSEGLNDGGEMARGGLSVIGVARSLDETPPPPTSK